MLFFVDLCVCVCCFCFDILYGCLFVCFGFFGCFYVVVVCLLLLFVVFEGGGGEGLDNMGLYASVFLHSLLRRMHTDKYFERRPVANLASLINENNE